MNEKMKNMERMIYDCCVVTFRYLENDLDDFEPYGTFKTFEEAYNKVIHQSDVELVTSEYSDYIIPAWRIVLKEGYDKTPVEYRFYMQQIQ